MATLTVFTPTYNRALLLSRSYEMLKKQTCKDFTWLIVDDGSVDRTEQIVREWVEEGIIKIRYVKTENRGKPSATNISIDLCDTDLWVCLDSDDRFSEDAVEVLVNDYRLIENNHNCGGIVGNMFTEDGKVFDGQALPDKMDYIIDRDIRYKYGVQSNLIRAYKTSVLKQYHYPIIPGEKFIGESYLYELINTTYYIERKKIYIAEYQEDGLTHGYLKLHVNNPKGYKLLKEQVMIAEKPFIHQFKGGIMYVAACLLCGDKYIIRNSPRKGITLLAFPFGVLAYYKKYYKLLKIRGY